MRKACELYAPNRINSAGLALMGDVHSSFRIRDRYSRLDAQQDSHNMCIGNA
jgi:hypothetical protein